jgi:hypothetical protein
MSLSQVFYEINKHIPCEIEPDFVDEIQIEIDDNFEKRINQAKEKYQNVVRGVVRVDSATKCIRLRLYSN